MLWCEPPFRVLSATYIQSSSSCRSHSPATYCKRIPFHRLVVKLCLAGHPYPLCVLAYFTAAEVQVKRTSSYWRVVRSNVYHHSGPNSRSPFRCSAQDEEGSFFWQMCSCLESTGWPGGLARPPRDVARVHARCCCCGGEAMVFSVVSHLQCNF